MVSNLWSVFSKEIHHRDGWWWFVRGLLHGGWSCSYAGLSGSGNDLSCSLNYSTLWACQDIQQDGVDRISTAFYSLVLITSQVLNMWQCVVVTRVLLPRPLQKSCPRREFEHQTAVCQCSGVSVVFKKIAYKVLTINLYTNWESTNI